MPAMKTFSEFKVVVSVTEDQWHAMDDAASDALSEQIEDAWIELQELIQQKIVEAADRETGKDSPSVVVTFVD